MGPHYFGIWDWVCFVVIKDANVPGLRKQPAHPLYPAGRGPSNPEALGGVTSILRRFLFFGLLVGNVPSVTIALLTIAPSLPPPPLAFFLLVCGWPRAPSPLPIPGLLPYVRHLLDSSI